MIPWTRLTATDLYHYLDWLKEAFDAGDELVEVEERGQLRVVFQVDRQLDRLERALAHISEPHYTRAMELVAELKRARMRANPNVAVTLVRLRTVIADWDRSRRSRRKAA